MRYTGPTANAQRLTLEQPLPLDRHDLPHEFLGREHQLVVAYEARRRLVLVHA